MKEVKAYQTEDGRLFTKYEEAKIHEEFKANEKDVKVNIYYSGCLEDWTISVRKSDNNINEAVEREFYGTPTEEYINTYHDLFFTELEATLRVEVIGEEEE